MCSYMFAFFPSLLPSGSAMTCPCTAAGLCENDISIMTVPSNLRLNLQGGSTHVFLWQLSAVPPVLKSKQPRMHGNEVVLNEKNKVSQIHKRMRNIQFVDTLCYAISAEVCPWALPVNKTLWMRVAGGSVLIEKSFLVAQCGVKSSVCPLWEGAGHLAVRCRFKGFAGSFHRASVLVSYFG